MQAKRTTSSPVPRLAINVPRLDELRKAHGIETEGELARLIGVDAATLYRVRNGITIPSNEFMAKVAAAFPAASLDQLLTVVKAAA